MGPGELSEQYAEWRHCWGFFGTVSDISGSGGVPIDGEQEGEGPAFRAGKGQVFPTCEPRLGHRESMGAKGQEDPLRGFRILIRNQ